jgi:hypothetical protein
MVHGEGNDNGRHSESERAGFNLAEWPAPALHWIIHDLLLLDDTFGRKLNGDRAILRDRKTVTVKKLADMSD